MLSAAVLAADYNGFGRCFIYTVSKACSQLTYSRLLSISRTQKITFLLKTTAFRIKSFFGVIVYEKP